MANRIKFILVALCLLFPVSAFADSLNIKGGRYAGGPVIILKLTEKQRHLIDKKYKPYDKMKLTKGQRAQIAAKAKMKEPPTKLVMVRAADTQGDCTCGLANIGLLLKGGVVEIPVPYLATDKEAKEMEIVD
ncbi:hypothetical protein [Geomonas anaerohicana]|uniref:Uncharacterized protein n=1 Tax=Geomonas anaerohicana TaxID=2798583 RepID=A0ABS0YJ86_9BACT|nr:hypothetical protein [Geomonas anaerohicana]MBJ6752394.1 hypothetical protein [Geomonas anaerohicana]